jgi:hypothetical protein
MSFCNNVELGLYYSHAAMYSCFQEENIKWQLHGIHNHSYWYVLKLDNMCLSYGNDMLYVRYIKTMIICRTISILQILFTVHTSIPCTRTSTHTHTYTHTHTQYTAPLPSSKFYHPYPPHINTWLFLKHHLQVHSWCINYHSSSYVTHSNGLSWNDNCFILTCVFISINTNACIPSQSTILAYLRTPIHDNKETHNEHISMYKYTMIA